MKYIKKYSLAIIAVLVFLLTCKSCQSCSRGRQIEYNQIECSHIVDSLKYELVEHESYEVALEDSIKILNNKIDNLNEMKGIMQGSLDRAHQTNKSLVNQIKNHN